MRLLSHKISSRLSARRRSKFAAPVVLLLGLLVTGGAYAEFNPANADSVPDSTASVSQGKALFEVGCASCHGKSAEGIITERGNEFGPSLVGVGAAAVDFQVGTGRMPLAQPGVQALQKEPVYTQKEIEQLAAFIASLGPGPAIPGADEYNPKGLSNAAMVEGGSFFRTNCTACHNFAGSGGALPQGKFAPAITNVTPKHIFEAMLTGPQQMPKFSNAVLTPRDKREIIAYLKTNNATPNYGGFTLGSLGPVSEGLFAWLIGIGGLVAAAIWIAAHTARVKVKR